jgi:hypothetical protein
MIPQQIRALALELYTVVVEGKGAEELAVWQRCLCTCRSRDVAPQTAVLISEALTGYLADGSPPQAPVVTPHAKAQAVLHRAVGTAEGGEICPAQTRLTPSAVAAMVGWVL